MKSCVVREKNHRVYCADQERNQTECCMIGLCARINMLHDNERNMVLCIADLEVAIYKTIINAIFHTVKVIEEEFVAQLRS